jgi:small subunit ribosomal protein S20
VANHKSAKKRARQTIVRTERNKARKSEFRSTVKNVQEAVSKQDKEGVPALLIKAQSLAAKLAQDGIIKKNYASRKVSRLFAMANK